MNSPLVANSIRCPHMASVYLRPVHVFGNASIRVFRNQNNRIMAQSRFGVLLYRRFCVSYFAADTEVGVNCV